MRSGMNTGRTLTAMREMISPYAMAGGISLQKYSNCHMGGKREAHNRFRIKAGIIRRKQFSR